MKMIRGATEEYAEAGSEVGKRIDYLFNNLIDMYMDMLVDVYMETTIPGRGRHSCCLLWHELIVKCACFLLESIAFFVFLVRTE